MVKIVISESESSSRKALQLALCGEGHAVRTASGGKDTALLVEGFGPDVVLLDMYRSVAQGVQPVGQIFLHHDTIRGVPVVFFAPAAYAAGSHPWTPSLAACGDGGLFGAFPEHVRSKTLEHVRRVCLSLSRCQRMMTRSVERKPRPTGQGQGAENVRPPKADLTGELPAIAPESFTNAARPYRGRIWEARSDAVAA